MIFNKKFFDYEKFQLIFSQIKKENSKLATKYAWKIILCYLLAIIEFITILIFAWKFIIILPLARWIVVIGASLLIRSIIAILNLDTFYVFWNFLFRNDEKMLSVWENQNQKSEISKGEK